MQARVPDDNEIRTRGKVRVLQGDAPRSKAAQRLMIFSNAADTREGLEIALRSRFSRVEIEMKGAVALFEARAD